MQTTAYADAIDAMNRDPTVIPVVVPFPSGQMLKLMTWHPADGDIEHLRAADEDDRAYYLLALCFSAHERVRMELLGLDDS
jgi:hypothetical protein